jgi:NACalpha-BTF3-like transcription factor
MSWPVWFFPIVFPPPIINIDPPYDNYVIEEYEEDLLGDVEGDTKIDILLIMNQTGLSYEVVEQGYIKNNADIVNAIIDLTM